MWPCFPESKINIITEVACIHTKDGHGKPCPYTNRRGLQPRINRNGHIDEL